MKPLDEQILRADLQTAQNRMFPFIGEAAERDEKEGLIATLQNDSAKLNDRFSRVAHQLFDLLYIPGERRAGWHMGIADSGKRAIEVLVDYFCTGRPGENVLVDTENYVAFNKFSAASALEKQKGVTFEAPFDLKLGQAVTINCETEFEKARAILHDNRTRTMWIAWNSTSTGVQEKVERLVKLRNEIESQTLIVGDAASFRLFTNDWETIPEEHFPDVFFFSLRKQGVPYEGPNDEVHQAKNSGAVILFNERARQQAETADDAARHTILNISGLNSGDITTAGPNIKHIKHLLKLNCVLDHFLSNNRENIKALDVARDTAHSEILTAFAEGAPVASAGFSLLSDPEAQSFSAYIVKIPDHIKAKELIARLKEKGIHISASMHPRLDHKRFVRFAFYPGNTLEEVEVLLKHLEMMAT